MRSRVLPLIALMAACLAPPPAPAALPAVLTRRAPQKAKPEVPGWGFYPRAPGVWLRYHMHLAAGRGRGSLLFFGDSLTFEWPDKDRGRADWQSRYFPLGVRDYGVGGDALSDGTNAEVAAGIAAVVHALRRRLPRQDVSYCRRVAAVNSFLPALADGGSHVRYLDMGRRFLLSPATSIAPSTPTTSFT